MTVKRHKHKRIFFTWKLQRLKPSSKPCQGFRHIIAAGVMAGTEYYLHATKGYRSVRLRHD